MRRRRRVIAAAALTTLLSLAGTAPAWAGAGNPSGTGPPSQSCQTIEAPPINGSTPGNAANSRGSPFNEPGINSPLGGIGGQHHSNSAQDDVACYHRTFRGSGSG